MNDKNSHHATVTIIRWIARIWSLLIFSFVVIRIFIPDPYSTEPVPFEDWFLLAMWGVAVLGLLIAWKWEFAGAVLVIATMFLREIAWVIIKGDWLVNFLIIWVIIVPPAILYFVAWGMKRKVAKRKDL
jgi:hypothetical protein